MTPNVIVSTPLQTPRLTAIVNPSTATTTQVIAGAAGKKFRVLAYAAMATAANNVTFKTNTTAVTPLWPLGANGGIVFQENAHGWFDTVAGDDLNVTTSAATATGIYVQYIILPA